MKLIKLLLGVPVVYLIFLCSGVGFTGCAKDISTIHDTTIKTVTDTLRDTLTVTIHDTLNTCDCNLTDGLIAYYNFNLGNLNDSSGYGNTIYANQGATATTDRFGRPNNAYSFNGVNNYMRVHNSASLNPDSITMFVIIKPNGFYQGPCAGNFILSKGISDIVNGCYSIGYQDLDAGCNPPDLSRESFGGTFGNNYPVGTGNQAGSDTSFITAGKWYYVTFTFDGKTAKLYVNGQLKDSRVKSTPFNGNTDDLVIGRLLDDNFPYWVNGVIDEIRIYNRALCATAVMQLNGVKE